MDKQSLQLIFCVETNKKTKSDYIYIMEIIDKFLYYPKDFVKFSFVYMDGKGKHNSANVMKEIESYIKNYEVGTNRKSEVIYVFDLDNHHFDISQNREIEQQKLHCQRNNFHFVYFIKTIEHVLCGKSCSKDENKQKRAISFKKKKEIATLPINRLKIKNENSSCGSNILEVLEEIISNYFDM